MAGNSYDYGLDEIDAEIARRGLNVQPTAAEPTPSRKADEDALGEMAKGLANRKILADRSAAFMRTQGDLGTGPIYGDIPGVNHAIPNLVKGATNVFDPAKAARLNDLDAINAATWTALRPPGSGPIRMFEAGGWKSAFPNTSTGGQGNQRLADRYQNEYATALNDMAYAQQQTRSGKGSVADALARRQAASKTPNARGDVARGLHEAPGAAFGDYSGNAPGWSGRLPPKQLAAAKLGNPNVTPGLRGNPYVPTSVEQARALPRGAWFIDDDGTYHQAP